MLINDIDLRVDALSCLRFLGLVFRAGSLRYELVGEHKVKVETFAYLRVAT